MSWDKNDMISRQEIQEKVTDVNLQRGSAAILLKKKTKKNL